MSAGGRSLLVLLFAVLVGLVVWLLFARGPSPGRAQPARDEAPAEESPRAKDDPAEAPARAVELLSEPGATEADGVHDGDTPTPKTAGIRARVFAEGRALDDAQVFVSRGLDTDEADKEEGGTHFWYETGDLTVTATHARYGPARKSVHAPDKLITEVKLELPAGEKIDVLVVSGAAGSPVAQASVTVLRAGGPGLEGGNSGLTEACMLAAVGAGDPDLSVLSSIEPPDLLLFGGAPAVSVPRLETDASGRVRIGGLPPGTVDLVVSHPDFVAMRLKAQPVGKEAVVRLSTGGSLTVLAPCMEGRVPENWICGAIRPVGMVGLPVAVTRVDAEGKASFPHLPPGPLDILVAKALDPAELVGLAMGGGVGVSSPHRDEAEAPKQIAEGYVTIRDGEHATLDLREKKGARIEGVLVADEEAREGVIVLLISGERQCGMQQTDALGKFVFEGVAAGRYGLHAPVGIGFAHAECEVKEGDAAVTVRLEMPKGVIIGRVLGADGKPVHSARVLVEPREGVRGEARTLADLTERGAGFAESDEEGCFRVEGVAPGDYRAFAAFGKRLDVATVTVREGEEARVDLRLDDARVRRLSVGLRGPDGPVEGTVAVLGADGGAVETVVLMDEDDIAEPKRSAAHEFFLAPGRYRLVAIAPGLAPALGEAVEVAGDRELTLTLGPGVRVELTIEGPAGPLVNLAVEVRNEHGIRPDPRTPFVMLLGGSVFRTDGGGVLTLEAVPPGCYTVTVEGKEAGRVEVGSTPVAKRLKIE